MAANNNHFDLTLDTLAPTGSIARPAAIMGANAKLTITKGDASFMYIWFDETPDTAVVPESAGPIAATADYTTKFTTDGIFYYHMQLEDDLGNKSEIYHTASMNYDTTKPEVENVVIADPTSHDTTITNDRVDNDLTFDAADIGETASNIVSLEISGDYVVGSPITVPASDTRFKDGKFTGKVSFTDAAPQGTMTVKVTATDAAGNTSAVATGSIVLDTELSKPVLVLLDKAETPAVLPEFINYRDIQTKLTFDADVVGYKIWEGDTEPGSYTAIKDKTEVVIEKTLTSGDAEKVFHARVIDRAGSEAYADTKPVKLDQTKPVISLSSDKAAISKVDGFNKAVISLAASDAYSGLKALTLKVNGATQVTAVPEGGKFNLMGDNAALVEGTENLVALDVEDIAGNTNHLELKVNLDTTAPASAAIGTLNEWYNAEFDINATAIDANIGMDHVFVWTSTTANDTTVPGTCSSVEFANGTHTIAAANIDKHYAQSAANYMHVKFVDKLGNVAYAHKQFGFDNVAPSKPTVTFTQTEYKTTAASVTIGYDDATSGVAFYKISGNIDNPSADWEVISTSRAVTLSEPEGMKKVKIQVKDKAENVSEFSAEAETELDQTAPAASIVLCNSGTEEAKDDPSNDRKVDAHISYTDDEYGSQVVEYKVYGTGIGKGNKDDVAWATFTKESGKSYMNIPCEVVGSDGIKQIAVIFKDKAGNVSDPATAQFELDQTAPIITAHDVDFNRISKKHTNRKKLEGGVISSLTSFNDEVNFQFTSDTLVKEFKVVAYADATAAAGGSHEDNAIGTVNGSTNMSGTMTPTVGPISCMIKGADFEAALGGEGNDGAHIVTVYAKDKGNTWSVAAQFNA